MAHSNQVPLRYCLHFALALLLFTMLWVKVNDQSVDLPSASITSGQSSGSGSSSVWDDRLADSSY